jgi:hypothetical protein
MSQPPWEYLADCSETSLRNFEIAQLAVAAGILKGIFADIEQLIEARVNANTARLLIEKPGEISRIATLRQGVLKFGDFELEKPKPGRMLRPGPRRREEGAA